MSTTTWPVADAWAGPRAPAGSPLAGCTAVVLGGGAGPERPGNGAAIALTYARHGADVVVADIDLAAAAVTVERLGDATGTARAVRVDVTDADALQALAADVRDREGRVDVLHNNVGVVRTGGPLNGTAADWDLVLRTNLTSVFLACKAFLPMMVAAGRGAVVNTSSAAGLVHTGYDYSAYYASKAGLNHFTRTLAVDLAATGVRVNAVVPGYIDAPSAIAGLAGEHHPGHVAEERAARVPVGRMGSVWDVAAAALFLASDAASYITGVCLPVDGGVAAAGTPRS